MSALGAIQGRPRRLANIAARNAERKREIKVKEDFVIEAAMKWFASRPGSDDEAMADTFLAEACEALRLARIGRTRGPKRAEP